MLLPIPARLPVVAPAASLGPSPVSAFGFPVLSGRNAPCRLILSAKPGVLSAGGGSHSYVAWVG